MRLGVSLSLIALGLGSACGQSSSDPGSGGGTSQALKCDLGTAFPDAGIIDPDAPKYQDANWTEQQVSEAFAKAKLDNSDAYRSYLVARKYEKYMTCAFCACGCAQASGHLSAIDCFKDMHGFT